MPELKKYTIVVVDDHPIIRDGLSMLLKGQSDMELIAQAGTAREVMMTIEGLKPDVLIADLSLPDKSGLELIRDALAVHPELLILVVSMHDETIYAERVLRAGAKGYITKDAASEELVTAIRGVIAGDIYVSQAIASLLLKRLSSNPLAATDESSVLRTLTDRELQVFELLGQALSNQTIADRLNISTRTVDAHKSHIKEKLSISDNNALLRYAVQWTDTT